MNSICCIDGWVCRMHFYAQEVCVIRRKFQNFPTIFFALNSVRISLSLVVLSREYSQFGSTLIIIFRYIIVIPMLKISFYEWKATQNGRGWFPPWKYNIFYNNINWTYFSCLFLRLNILLFIHPTFILFTNVYVCSDNCHWVGNRLQYLCIYNTYIGITMGLTTNVILSEIVIMIMSEDWL